MGMLYSLNSTSSTFWNIRYIYRVATQKQMLNVQKVRLRFIFARALYLYRLFQKAYGRGIAKGALLKYVGICVAA